MCHSFQPCWLAMDLVSTVCMHYTYTLTHLLTYTQTHLTHTCCSRKWYFLSSLMCAFSSAVFCWRNTSSCGRFSASLRQLGAQRQTSVGEGKMSWGWQKHFSFGQPKYKAGIMHLCGGCKAAEYPYKALMVVHGVQSKPL